MVSLSERGVLFILGFSFPLLPAALLCVFFFPHFIYPVVCISGGNGSVSVSQGVAAPSIIVYLIVCACLCVKERERRRGMENSAVHHPRSLPPLQVTVLVDRL